MTEQRKIYNKLIRDKIPDILHKKNIDYKVKILSSEEYIQSLFDKITEELNELKEEQNLEEFIDLIEVMYAIKRFFCWSKNDIRKTRLMKLKTNGGFRKRLFLIDTIELENK